MRAIEKGVDAGKFFLITIKGTFYLVWKPFAILLRASRMFMAIVIAVNLMQNYGLLGHTTPHKTRHVLEEETPLHISKPVIEDFLTKGKT